MAKSGTSPAGRGLQVRGTVDVEKFKAARALGGDQVTFELRAMRPAKVGTETLPDLSCVPCVCVVCVVCAASTAEELGLRNLPALQD